MPCRALSPACRNWRRRIRIETFTGDGVRPYLADLARLRISVFRDFPYLYDGNEAHERSYLKVFAQTPRAVVVVARDGERVVGASTAMPLAAETDNVQKPFLEAGWDISRMFYFSESVLESAYRGRGIGLEFFRQREAAAAGYATTAFCAVQRPVNHPLRPADYVPLDEFWRHRGYSPHPELVCNMSWRDTGEERETAKPLMFWTKDL